MWKVAAFETFMSPGMTVLGVFLIATEPFIIRSYQLNVSGYVVRRMVG